MLIVLNKLLHYIVDSMARLLGAVHGLFLYLEIKKFKLQDKFIVFVFLKKRKQYFLFGCRERIAPIKPCTQEKPMLN